MSFSLSVLAPIAFLSFAGAAASPQSEPPPALPSPEFCERTSSVRAGGDVTAPRLVKRVAPVYPKEARKEGAQGKVVLQVVVTPEGLPESLEVVHSPDPRLTESALAAVRKWRYEPATRSGRPVRACVAGFVGFSLKPR